MIGPCRRQPFLDDTYVRLQDHPRAMCSRPSHSPSSSPTRTATSSSAGARFGAGPPTTQRSGRATSRPSTSWAIVDMAIKMAQVDTDLQILGHDLLNAYRQWPVRDPSHCATFLATEGGLTLGSISRCASGRLRPSGMPIAQRTPFSCYLEAPYWSWAGTLRRRLYNAIDYPELASSAFESFNDESSTSWACGQRSAKLRRPPVLTPCTSPSPKRKCPWSQPPDASPASRAR